MSDVPQIPDLAAALTTYLTADSAVSDIVGDEVVSKTPQNTDQPWVRISQLDGGDGGIADRLVDYLVQFDCYAGESGGKAEAVDLGRAVRAALKNANNAQVDGTVITDARVNSHSDALPDEDLSPARERVMLLMTIWAHG